MAREINLYSLDLGVSWSKSGASVLCFLWFIITICELYLYSYVSYFMEFPKIKYLTYLIKIVLIDFVFVQLTIGIIWKKISKTDFKRFLWYLWNGISPSILYKYLLKTVLIKFSIFHSIEGLLCYFIRFICVCLYYLCSNALYFIFEHINDIYVFLFLYFKIQ